MERISRRRRRMGDNQVTGFVDDDGWLIPAGPRTSSGRRWSALAALSTSVVSLSKTPPGNGSAAPDEEWEERRNGGDVLGSQQRDIVSVPIAGVGPSRNGPLPPWSALLLALGALDFVGHVLVGGNYGYFRDELYYIVSGRHLAFGYVDFPPMIAVLAALLGVLTRDNLIAIHVVSAAASACLVVVAGLMARELGGGRGAQLLAALATLAVPVFLATGSLFSMDVLDALWWSLCAWTLLRLLRRDAPRLWLLFGLFAGLGLLTKLTIVFFGMAIVVGLALTPARRSFRTPWPWLGGTIAAACAAPYVLWNAEHGWPTVEFWHHYGGHTGGGPVGFLVNQIVSVNPLTVPLALAGLWYYLRAKDGQRFRAIGWAYVVLYVALTAFDAKAYFLAPAYPMLFAGGAVVVESVAVGRRRWAWLPRAHATVLVATALLLAPLAMPILPPAVFARSYASVTSIGNRGGGQSTVGVFPQYLGDRFGWDSMTATIDQVYARLPLADQARACVFTGNYGEASALSFLGPPALSPTVISGHNTFALWGPGSCTGEMVITVGLSRGDVEQSFGRVVQVATITCDYCMSSENNLPVYIGTQPKASIDELWPRAQHFD